MTDRWLLFNSGPEAPAMNMAVDEALLEHAPRLGMPVLRFYGWAAPAATFGYSQRYGDAAAWTPLRPLIRRPTGGGLVPHDRDWTYSLAVPPKHPWYALKAVESYRRVHQWIQQAFASLGIEGQLAVERRKSVPGQCFVGAEQFDLIVAGVKIAGAAQRRTRSGLLIQGSVQPGAFHDRRSEWENAMLHVERAAWVEFSGDARLFARAQELEQEKYSQARYNERR